ncbi:defective chorion protein, FC177 isoform-like, partial [Eurosta solidaginis]|uniref:defective chorion protein, FC177 isoform-like n=1 Tax=Eurosta solidaginis TaxID=178769 RepID=UPI0035307F6B
LRLKDILNISKLLKKSKCGRHKRNSDYGTLQPIDAASLEELRKTYKDLKEITLKPDEDPAEALMRYNAASIREALEHANGEPLEVNAADLSTNEPHCGHGAHVTVLNHHEHARTPTSPQPNIYKHERHIHMGKQRHDSNSAHFNHNLQQTRGSTNKNLDDPAIERQNQKETIKTAIDATQIPLSSRDAASVEARSMISSLPESELQTVMELIKQQMQTCCDACRERILSSIKSNIQNANASEIITKATSLKIDSIKDAEFEQWLREMEFKGYDSKYLTKSHYWEYLNSGKLTLTVESNEEASAQAQNDNKIAKKSNESSQTLKRYAQSNSVLKVDESKSRNKKMGNRANGKAFMKDAPNPNYVIKDHAHVVNDELHHIKEYTVDERDHTPNLYALRGKFKLSKRRNTTDAMVLTTPKKLNTMTKESPTLNNKNNVNTTNSGKAVELLSLLYDLGPTVQTENGKPKQISMMVMPFLETSTKQTEQANFLTSTSNNMTSATTTKTRTKRLRLRRKKVEHTDPATCTDPTHCV